MSSVGSEESAAQYRLDAVQLKPSGELNADQIMELRPVGPRVMVVNAFMQNRP